MSAEKIGDIKEQLKSITDSQLTQFIEAYGSDERGGVIKLVDSAKKRLDKYEKELIRTEGLKKYEREYASYAHICGIDEVGRGPLAGRLWHVQLFCQRTVIFYISMIQRSLRLQSVMSFTMS